MLKLKSNHSVQFLFIFSILLLQGCAGVKTFPVVARAGDTVSVMIGSSERARKNTVSVQLTDANAQVWDLQALGMVRSLFNLRADAIAVGNHYASYSQSFLSWSEGHEPVQTVLVIDIPSEAAAGDAVLTIDTTVTDDSSGVGLPYTMNLEILPGLGSSDFFMRKDPFAGNQPVDFSMLEPAPHAKITFGNNDGVVIGAASLVVDFDETIVDPGDINIYIPVSNVRGSFSMTGNFGDKQLMAYWRQDGAQLFIDIVAPQGINQRYVMVYVIHPVGITAPGISILSSMVYDVSGNEIILTPQLEYFP